jgi:DNA-binding NarL/FixJ family response regulator
MIRVLIADDHAVVAEGLRHLIQMEPDMQVVGCVADGVQAVRSSLETNPDIVLMDNAMPDLNGTEATLQLRGRRPTTRVIMLSMHTDPVLVWRALDAGARGYVLKKSVAKDLMEAIRTVYGGRRYLSRPLLDSVFNHLTVNNTSSDPLARLSARERQVVQMLAEGRAMAEIATLQSLSLKTVETYRARAMVKLGVRDFAGLVKFAVRHGMTSFE